MKMDSLRFSDHHERSYVKIQGATVEDKSRSPTADPRDGRARGGLLAPDRSSVPGQPVLRGPTVAAPPQHGLPPTQAPWRREPGQTRATGPGTAPGTGPTAARCHP